MNRRDWIRAVTATGAAAGLGVAAATTASTARLRRPASRAAFKAA